jgi:hypothetical protein
MGTQIEEVCEQRSGKSQYGPVLLVGTHGAPGDSHAGQHLLVHGSHNEMPAHSKSVEQGCPGGMSP